MAGRPKADIDWDIVTKYLQAQCEATGIASILGISVDTLYVRCEKDHNMTFSAFAQQKKSEGKELLRNKQFELAMSGEKTMLVWLGKQYLEQKDKSDITSKDESINKIEGFRIIIEDERHTYAPQAGASSEISD